MNNYSFLLSNNLAKGHYTLYAGSVAMDDLIALENEIGFKLPDDFKDFSMSNLGGLYVEATEEVWPRPKPLDVGPFWTFLYGLYVYGISPEIQDWMDLKNYREFQSETKSDLVPFMKVISDADVYCFAKDQTIHQWDHETNEFNPINKTFIALLNDELAELEKRKVELMEMKK